MASDHRRKRLNGASMVLNGSPQQHRSKRKNSGLVQNELTMKSHVSVEWDSDHQRVVAKRGQIGISWRQMKPFVNFIPNGHSILTDVLAIPQEFFGLNNLIEVLSYEVWNTLLSDDDRNFLMQFLPSGLDPDQVVQELLSGDNINFGNPSMSWGTALCSGDLHPDRIVYQERHLKSDKREYYSQLSNYHNDMIGLLTKLKRSWEGCKDPENEIVQKIWRSNNVEKRIPSNMNEFQVNDHNGNVAATSESCSWDAEEKIYSHNQISLMGHGVQLHKRVLDNSNDKGKQRNMVGSTDDMLNVETRPVKGDKLNPHSWDDDRYISCIKVSKKQHELYQSMKLSSKSIQSKTLGQVLGDIDNIHVQPYEVFIKEEQDKLHDHWLQLVNKHFPAAYANWTDRQIQIQAIRNSLVAELNEKSKPLVEDEDVVSSGVQIIKDQEEDRGPTDQSSMEDSEDCIGRSPENQSHNHSCNNELNSLSMDSGKNCDVSKSDYASQNKNVYSRNMNNTQDVLTGEEAPFSSDAHVWKAVEMPHSYYNSDVPNNCTANSLSLVNTQVNEEQQTQLVGLESDLHQEDTIKELLHRPSDDVPFSSYQSQDQIDLIESILKRDRAKTYHHQLRPGSDFQASNNVVIGDGQFSSHFKEPLQTSLTLDQGQRRAGEVLMPENMTENNISDGGRYVIPRQDPLSAVNITGWAVNAPRMSAPSQSHLNVNTGDFIAQRWFSSGHQARGGWNGSDGASLSSQNLGTGGSSDQSLYSILSHCSQLRSISHHNLVRPNDQFIALHGVADPSKPRIHATAPPSSHPLDYISGGCETPDAMVNDEMAWTLPQQNSALHDQRGKQYFRSSN